jgi:hypothetical protein
MLLTNSFIYSSHGMAAATWCVRPDYIDLPDKNCPTGKNKKIPEAAEPAQKIARLRGGREGCRGVLRGVGFV